MVGIAGRGDTLLDCLDGRGRPAGQVRRKDLFKSQCGFRTVHAFVLNEEGKLLVQQIGTGHPRSPLAWGSSMAAYVHAGETYTEAAVRRLRQELGIRPVTLCFQGVVEMNDLGHLKQIGLFSLKSSGPFVLEPFHVQRVEFLSIEEILLKAESGALTVTPTFRVVLEFYNRLNG